MIKHASYIYSAYTFIHSLSRDQISQVGNQLTDGNPIPSFDEDLLISLCDDVQKIFEREENIINLYGDVIVVGDIHGSLHDLLRIIHYTEANQSKVLFLGDYVDRGNFSLECITLLFTLKVLKPEKYYLLRGNHEFDSVCSKYGFKKEILNYHNPKKANKLNNDQPKIHNTNDIDFDFEEEEEDINDPDAIQEFLCDDYYANHININCYKYTEKLYEAFIKAFSYLPICAIVNNTSICLHGGISPLLDNVENINQIPRPTNDFDEDLLLSDIVWGDPSPGLAHFFDDSPRGRGKLFSGAAVVNFLKNNNLTRLIRAHECVTNGIEELFNEKCITVFSASSYSCDMGNYSGFLKITQENDEIEPIMIIPLSRLQKYDAHYYKVQSYSQTVNNKSKFSVCNQKISEYKSGFLSSLINFGNTHSEQNMRLNMNRSQSKQFTLAETENYGRKGLSCEHISCQSIGIRKAKYINKIPSLRSGPRKKITPRNCCINSKIPSIITPQMTHQNIDLSNPNQPHVEHEENSINQIGKPQDNSIYKARPQM